MAGKTPVIAKANTEAIAQPRYKGDVYGELEFFVEMLQPWYFMSSRGLREIIKPKPIMQMTLIKMQDVITLPCINKGEDHVMALDLQHMESHYTFNLVTASGHLHWYHGVSYVRASKQRHEEETEHS